MRAFLTTYPAICYGYPQTILTLCVLVSVCLCVSILAVSHRTDTQTKCHHGVGVSVAFPRPPL